MNCPSAGQHFVKTMGLITRKGTDYNCGICTNAKRYLMVQPMAVIESNLSMGSYPLRGAADASGRWMNHWPGLSNLISWIWEDLHQPRGRMVITWLLKDTLINNIMHEDWKAGRRHIKSYTYRPGLKSGPQAAINNIIRLTKHGAYF